MRFQIFSSRTFPLLAAGVALAIVLGVGVARTAFPQLRQARQSATAEDWTCPMHPDVHEHHPGRCPICGMTLERKTPAASDEAHAEAHESRAETANPARPGVIAPAQAEAPDPRAPIEIDGRRRQLLGVRVAHVETAALSRTIRAPGVVKFDESRWTTVTLRTEGYVRELYVDRTGQTVHRGQPLFSVYSPDIAMALAEYRLARQAQTALSTSSSDAAREQAARLVDAARLRLTRWDVSEDQIDRVGASGEPRTVFRSPAAGIVMEKMVVRGMRAMPGDVLYKIVDPSRVWIEASIYEPDLAAVSVGQRGIIHLNTFPAETFDGRVTYVAPGLDPEARTAAIRFELANRGGRLKAGMFASVDLDVPLGRGLVVPADAVLDSGRRQLVFVSNGNGYFEPRDVTIGQKVDGRVQIVTGLAEGDAVAESAAFFIDSESQLRAASQGYAQSRSEPTITTPAQERLSIDVVVTPDPPKAGPATLTVRVLSPDRQPLADATVKAVFAMAAMPSMNMPAMRAEATLGNSGHGVYTGAIDVPMSGRWDVTVTVSRGSQRLGARQLTVMAR